MSTDQEKYCYYNSPLGKMLLTGNDTALAGAYFDGQKHLPDVSNHKKEAAAFAESIKQLDEYFAGQRKAFDLKLAAKGTPLQVRIWNELKKIGFGKKLSYSDIATRIGKPGAVRAVGAAIGKNPHSIITPCHRVLGKNGQLTGYAGGLKRKEALLKLESK